MLISLSRLNCHSNVLVLPLLCALMCFCEIQRSGCELWQGRKTSRPQTALYTWHCTERGAQCQIGDWTRVATTTNAKGQLTWMIHTVLLSRNNNYDIISIPECCASSADCSIRTVSKNKFRNFRRRINRFFCFLESKVKYAVQPVFKMSDEV